MSRPLTGGEPDLSNVRPPEMSPMPGPAVGRPTAENAPCAGAALPSVSPNAAADGRTEPACVSAVPVSPKYGIVRYFRNPEVRRAVLLFLAAAFLAGAGCFFYVGSGEGFRGGALAGVCAAGGCLLGLLLYLLLTYGRYRRLRDLSAQLSEILLGRETLAFSDFREGELAILQTELWKLVVRMREQRDQLAAERGKLAESMQDISHQLRTPLTSMNLTLELLRDSDLPPERRAGLLRQLRSMTGRIDRLCVMLLKLARLDAGTVEFRRETCSLRTLAGQAAAPLAVLLDLKSQALRIEGDADAFVDPVWTLEAVSNLVKNCVEHTPEGGVIRVCLTQNPLYAEIVVEDNGPGFSREDLPHLFERFYRGKGSTEGFGIGLALARGVFTSQNGAFKAENRPKGGARFIGRFYTGRTI